MRLGISLGVGVFQFLVAGAALHGIGVNAHPGVLLMLAYAGASGWFVYQKAFA